MNHHRRPGKGRRPERMDGRLFRKSNLIDSASRLLRCAGQAAPRLEASARFSPGGAQARRREQIEDLVLKGITSRLCGPALEPLRAHCFSAKPATPESDPDLSRGTGAASRCSKAGSKRCSAPVISPASASSKRGFVRAVAWRLRRALPGFWRGITGPPQVEFEHVLRCTAAFRVTQVLRSSFLGFDLAGLKPHAA